MKSAAIIAIVLLLAAQSAIAGERGRVTGDIVDQPTARQALLAWRITTGTFDGVTLDGLTVVAAVASDSEPGTREIRSDDSRAVRAVVSVDARATPAQRDALVALVREMSGGLISEIVRVESAPIRFATTSKYVEISVPDTLELVVNKK